MVFFLRACFAVGLAMTQLWAAMMCKSLSFVPLLSRKTREGVAMVITQLSWRIALFLARSWIAVDCDAVATRKEWREVVRLRREAKASGDKRPFFFVANHMSFLDTILNVALLPSSVAFDSRGYIGSFLLKMPVLGTILRAMGAFPVHFKGVKDGDFRLDKERMGSVEKTVDAHLGSGGALCFFPEGQQNSSPDSLLPFRYGGMKRAIAFDARVWAVVCVGNDKIWPKNAQVGGYPGRIRYGLVPIAPNGCKALVQELLLADAQRTASGKSLDKIDGDGDGDDDEPPPAMDYELLATHMRATMQSEYNSLKEAVLRG